MAEKPQTLDEYMLRQVKSAWSVLFTPANMDTPERLQQANRIVETIRRSSGAAARGAVTQAEEFLRCFAGPKSAFTEAMHASKTYTPEYAGTHGLEIMRSFVQYVEAGLHQEISPQRRAELDVVSDFLDQAGKLLEIKGVHPAAPTVLIGATLEEFLRTWVEAEALSLGNRRPGLDAYCQVLREMDLITKQDAKDIAAWGGVRNHAAHGDWEEVADPHWARLMLEGVNLFMRKYSG